MGCEGVAHEEVPQSVIQMQATAVKMALAKNFPFYSVISGDSKSISGSDVATTTTTGTTCISLAK